MFSGSIVALVTPMQKDGSIDWSALDVLLQMHLSAGTDGVVVAGTTGESATLTMAEHQALIEYTVNTVRGRIPVIAGTSAIAVNDAIHLTRMAMTAGADACLLLTPPYVKPTQEGLFYYYQAIAEAVPVPQILYNVPGRTACDLLPETVERLAHIPNIVGIKDATGRALRVRQLLAGCAGRLDVYSGDDATALEFMFEGAKGVISVTANVAPHAMHAMCKAALADDRPLARMLNERLKWLHDKLFVESSPIPVKWALHEMQLIQLGIRLPLTPLNPVHHDTLRRAMRHAEIIESLQV